MMPTTVNEYLATGCGRCSLGGTPDCKVHKFPELLRELRAIALATNLTETIKWGNPCYTYNNKNIIMVAAFKEFATLSFFKGAFLKDELGILVKQGENQREGRIAKFTQLSQVLELESVLLSYIQEAIEVEKSGVKFNTEKANAEEKYPEEFISILNNNPELLAAFEALTPGRKRGYNIYFSGAKQAQTRIARIEKYIPHILNGKGFHDK